MFCILRPSCVLSFVLMREGKHAREKVRKTSDEWASELMDDWEVDRAGAWHGMMKAIAYFLGT